ncbi:MAG: glutamate-1-semialdehyde 2,1-aminomutase [Planctomycetota bacterium]|jgi:glutamate-1-semialdehyde 2,1-aminomutase
MKRQQSDSIFSSAAKLIPGGVNSPVRAWKAVGGNPVHLASGDGAWVTDVDGNRYVDLVCAYGPLILGHSPASVKEALHSVVETGTALGAPSAAELDIAEMIVERCPAVEMIRLVNSGTEATMSALRLARAATGRDHMLKFNGCYHGHGDSFLVKAGSGALTLGAPDSPGVPASLAELTLVTEYNDLEEARAMFAERGHEIACVFVEPVAGNMGCVLPVDGFLEGLRALCDEYGALLIYDEVMTGFRVARGGYQELSAVKPDLVTLGKVIGGGLPIGAYGGRADLMNRISPAGDVYQAGTLSGNPLAVAAGIATLKALDEPGVYADLESKGAYLQAGLEQAARDNDVPIYVGRQGAMLCPYLSSKPVHRFQDAMDSDRERWVRFFGVLVEQGVHLAPSPFEAWFISTAHDEEALDHVIAAARLALKA